MNENRKIGGEHHDTLGVQMIDNESVQPRGFVGEVTDTITYPDGRVEVLEGYNIVVDDIAKLLACFIKNEAGYSPANLYWAFGQGEASWDDSPYNAVKSTTRLVSEVYRKPVQSRTFVDSNGNQTGTVTNRVELMVTLGSDEANGNTLREFGIFGGNASGTVNSGIMINHKAHARIDKVEGMQIDRRIRFTF